MSDHTSTDHADKAKELFLEGYNCAQSVFCAFSDITGLDMETSARLASSFGGGLGRLREFAQRFREAEGSIICRELLTKANIDPQTVKAGGDPEARTSEYYKKRPCPELAWRAAHILDVMLAE